MRDGRDAREKQDGQDSKFEVRGSKFRKPQTWTSDLRVSPFPPVSPGPRGDPAG
jgi:hypothetical protein